LCLWQASACRPCQQGTYSGYGASVCLVCEAGFFTDVNGSTICQDCPAGTWSDGSSSACHHCWSGTYSETIRATSGGTCVSCPGGTYSNMLAASSLTDCLWCDAGTFSYEGAYQCTPCDTNFYSSMYSTVCIACPEFSYTLQEGSSLSQCICHAGYKYDWGVSPFGCTPCNAGYWSPPDSEQCVACLVGTWSNMIMATSSNVCQNCGTGMYTSVEASVSCSNCSTGYYSSGVSSSVCQACPIGSWTNTSGVSICTKCPAGMYGTLTGQLSEGLGCQACASGTYSTSIGLSSISGCVTCPDGFISLPQASSCYACGANTYLDSSLGVCTSCPVNSESPPGSFVESCQCLAGYYKYYRTRGSGGQESYQYNAGSTWHIHLLESVGSMTLLVSTNVYIQCDGVTIGDYFAYPGSVSTFGYGCKVNSSVMYIVDGFFSSNESPTYFKCQECGPGMYSSSSGWDVCQPCPPGTAGQLSGGISCSTCPSGTIAPGYGGIDCDFCPTGTYQSGQACLNCSIGTYNPGTASTICSICSPGTFSDTGASMCLSCPDGAYSLGHTNLSGCHCYTGYVLDYPNFRCSGCPTGTYWQNESSCVSCESGMYNPDVASTTCFNCGNFTYTSQTGMSACEYCSYGYLTTPRRKTCVTCPLSYYCPVNTYVFLPCPLGSFLNISGLYMIDQCTRCPVNYYCLDTTTIEICPPHTHSYAGATSKLDCWCDQGYTCTYKKAIRAVVTLPMTVEQFAGLRNEFIQAVAAAARVSPDKVSITSVKARSTSLPGRRLLLDRQEGLYVHVHVKDASGLNLLSHHLNTRGLPSTHKKIRIDKDHHIIIQRHEFV